MTRQYRVHSRASNDRIVERHMSSCRTTTSSSVHLAAATVRSTAMTCRCMMPDCPCESCSKPSSPLDAPDDAEELLLVENRRLLCVTPALDRMQRWFTTTRIRLSQDLMSAHDVHKCKAELYCYQVLPISSIRQGRKEKYKEAFTMPHHVAREDMQEGKQQDSNG